MDELFIDSAETRMYDEDTAHSKFQVEVDSVMRQAIEGGPRDYICDMKVIL